MLNLIRNAKTNKESFELLYKRNYYLIEEFIAKNKGLNIDVNQINKLYIGSYKDDKNDVLLNEKGKVLCSYPYITKFSHNYAVVSLPDNKEGYINTKGKLVYSGEGTCSSFSWDYACIQDKNGDYWTIDSSFNKLHNFGKEYICVFSSLVECNNKYYETYN